MRRDSVSLPVPYELLVQWIMLLTDEEKSQLLELLELRCGNDHGFGTVKGQRPVPSTEMIEEYVTGHKIHLK